LNSEETVPRGRTEDGTFKAEREPGEPLTREELAAMLSDILKKLHARATAPRFKAKKTDPALMALVRAFVQGATALNGVIRDRDLDEIEERITKLEAAREARERRQETPLRMR
jgi:hypothetical protein